MRKFKPLPAVWIVGGLIVIAFLVAFLVQGRSLGRTAGWALAAIFLAGIALALAASREEGKRAEVWGDLGRSLLVAGLMAFSVWLIGEQQRPVEERSSLQVTLGLQQDLPGADLRDKDLSGFDLSGRDLSEANLEGVDLAEATLFEADLTGANLVSADLSGANLEHANFSGADLSDADLEGAEATKTNFHEARMAAVDLSGAQLSGADLRSACLAEGSLVDASLPDAHLEDAALTGADLEGARFWFDLRRAFLTGIGLDGAENAGEARWPPAFTERVAELVAPDKEALPTPVTAPEAESGTGRVLAVPDGDTVLIATPSGKTRVRLSSIDAPDIGAAHGGAARDELRRMLPENSPVSFVHDRRRADDFGRALLYVFDQDEEMVNQLMIARGAAVLSPDEETDEGVGNFRYWRQLKDAESWARQHARGLWAECPP